MLAPLLALRERLDRADLGRDLVWVFPSDFARGITEAWGMRIIRAEVQVALLAYENPWKQAPSVQRTNP